MLKRIVTGIVGLALFAAVIFFANPLVLNLALAAVSAIAVYEALHRTGMIKNPALVAGSICFAAVVPFLENDTVGEVILALYVFFLLAVLLVAHKTVTPGDVSLAFMFAVTLSLSLCTLLYLREIADLQTLGLTKTDGIFLLLLAVIGAWGTDIGAYFIGRFFGKHKLAPAVSPKKTVEGAVGGLAVCIVLFLAYGSLYGAYFLKDGGRVSLPLLAALAVICALLSMLGDLSASCIKRAAGIKDFGNIFPGHGGILDRFDSLLTVAPAVYLLVQLLPVVVRN
ncbi:MAG: phosphatidate cytidylyltransferase [Oscillospiraceae bacterium]|jgi:phosphatidate cytidylyltransferase|nr:phosphatidate cytidylyltransferase [Oscillospiraceae bacterium]